jgi:hypothetical protein
MTEHAEESRGLGNTGVLGAELYIDPWLMLQQNVANLLSSDPFVPKAIRKAVATFYLKRVVEMSTASEEVMTQFCEDLYTQNRMTGLDLKIQFWGRLGDEYFKIGWGWEQAEK